MPIANIAALRKFIPASQLAVIRSCVSGEEGSFFSAKLVELSELIRGMPRIYEQDGQGKTATAYLHYFCGGFDWYITERDTSESQLQAFGLEVRGSEAAPCYINLAALIAAGAELDLHFSPTTLEEIRAVPV